MRSLILLLGFLSLCESFIVNEFKSMKGKSLALALFLLCLVSAFLIALDVLVYCHDDFDRAVILFVAQHRSQGMVNLMHMVTLFGAGNFLLPAYLVLIAVLLLKKQYFDGIAVALTGSAGWLILAQLKLLFHRHRPDLPLISNIATYSFPSGHSFSSLVFFGILAFYFRQFLQGSARTIMTWIFLACPFLIALSRVMLNVHYASDVLAGLSLGFVWLYLSYLLIYRNMTRLKR